MIRKLLPLVAVLLTLAGTVEGEERSSAGLAPAVQTFLRAHCQKCHGPEKQEADFRVDTMLKVSATAADAEYWRLVLDNLNLDEMPPAGQPRPPAAQTEAVIAWIEAELTRAEKTLAGHAGEVVLRRLNRLEYENTLRDLLNAQGDFADGFPEDATADGFDNNGAALTLSAEQLTRYLKAAEDVLKQTIETRSQPDSKKIVYSLRQIQEDIDRRNEANERRKKASKTKPTASELKREAEKRRSGNYGSPYFAPHGDEALIVVRYTKPHTGDFFRIRDRGYYRFRFTASAYRNHGKGVRLQVTSGTGRPTEVPNLIEVIQLTDDQPREFEYRVFLEPGQRIQLEMLDGTNWTPGSRILESTDVAISIGAMEMEGPLFDQWPPAGHRILLGTRKPDELRDEEMPTILAEMAPRLFRRPTSAAVVQEYVAYYRGLRAEPLPPLDAFRLTVQAMLASPQFLYHLEPTGDDGAIDAYALANRLSYFLWRSLPDEELQRLAASQALLRPDVLHQQVERLLADPKSERFLTDFVGQWLQIKGLGEMQPDANLYPEYDAELERAMVAETHSFLREMLQHDLPLSNLIDSDWAMLNDRLAQHYGVPGVEGLKFRRVALDKSATIRGGLLTQASILNVTSNGTTTSPVVRGVWVLDRLLGSTAPPPPPDVPAIEPDIRGATTIQEQLAAHRSIQQCASCHVKIDPYGIALENFDVIGGWRDNYRGLQPTANPNRPKMITGPAVDSSDELPQLGAFADFREFRKLLRQRQNLVDKNVARRLAAFALGRELNFADESSLQQMVAAADSRPGGLKSMIHALVASDLFRRP